MPVLGVSGEPGINVFKVLRTQIAKPVSDFVRGDELIKRCVRPLRLVADSHVYAVMRNSVHPGSEAEIWLREVNDFDLGMRAGGGRHQLDIEGAFHVGRHARAGDELQKTESLSPLSPALPTGGSRNI